jgi:hypothetical protein
VSESATQRPIVDAEPARRMNEARPVPRSDRARSAAYRGRFAAVYLALAVVAGLGVGALFVLVARPDAAPAQAWSQWEPTGSENAKTRQIADYVSKAYQIEGNRLTLALVGPPQVTSADGTAVQVPISAIAVLPDTRTGQQEEGDVNVVDTARNLQIVLCGLGENCSIAFGEPSPERHTLLRRQVLETALYTFRYVDGIDSVTAFLPPALPQSQDQEVSPTAVFIERGDVTAELDQPLARTLSAETPSIGQISEAELDTVSRITLPRVYTFGYQQAQDGSAVLVLRPAA